MENALIFASEKEVRFTKLLKFIVPTYLTSLFNTVYTIIDGIFVSTYVGTNALASINIVYPIVNVLTGIALVFATGGSAVTALHIGGNRKKEADRSFSVSSFAAILLGCLVSLMILTNLSAILTILGATPVTIAGCKTYARWWLLAAPVVIGKELFTYFIRVDGAPTYSFITALSGGILNIVLDYILVGQMQMGIYGAALATILGLVLSFSMGIYYFIHKQKYLSFTLHNLSLREAIVWRCISRLESTGLECLARTINELVLQDAVVKAINQMLGDKSNYQAQLQLNIATVIRASQATAIDSIDEKLMALQQELIQKANSKEDYDEIADEIFRLRELRQKTTVDTAARDEQIKRINDLQD